MNAASNKAEQQAYNALPRYLAILAAGGAVSIGLMVWTVYAGVPEHWRTVLLLLNVFADGILVNHFILRHLRKSLKAQGAAR